MALAALLSLLASSGESATLRVPSSYQDINAAMGAAVAGDTVLVAAGTYSDVDTRAIPWNGTGTYTTTSIVFLRDGVVLKSELGSGATVLDMGPVVAPGDPVAVVGSGLGSTTVIEGFTIQGGPHIPSWGVVLDSESEDLTIRDCKILEFDARPFSAAAVLHEGKGHTLRIEQSEMGGCRGAGAGAVGVVDSDLIIVGSLFEGNRSSGGGGAIRVTGTDFAPVVNVVDVSGCVFMNNDGGSRGAAFAHGTAGAYASFSFSDCAFIGNTAFLGGAVILETADEATGTFERCVFNRNESNLTPGGVGGALLLTYGSFLVSECTFWGSRATSVGSAIFFGAGAVGSVERSVVAGSSGSAAVASAGGASVSTGCDVFWANADGDVEGLSLQETDRIVDPMFCDEVTGDFTLRAGSPCLPANSMGCGLIGALMQGCGTVSIEPKSWAAIKSAYRTED